jgi:hypothetical protein
VTLVAALLALSGRAKAQTPVVGSHPAAVTSSAKSSVTVSANAGDLIAVFCVPDPTAAMLVTDGAGDTFTAFPVPVSHDSASIQTFWARAVSASTSLVVSCVASAVLSYNQIYTAVVCGAGTPTAVAASGTSGAASATIGSLAGDLVLAMGESGSVSNSTGWTALSKLNSNLLTSEATAGAVTASFSASGAWNLVLVDIPPAVVAPFRVTLPGCCTVTFPITSASQVPSCTATDGTCSIVIQICDAANPPNCLSSNAGTLSLVKTVTLPTPQTQTIPVATAGP